MVGEEGASCTSLSVSMRNWEEGVGERIYFEYQKHVVAGSS